MLASFIVLLYLAGYIKISGAITSLYVAGALLIIAELGIVSFGMIAFNGLIALYAAYTLQTGSDILFGLSIGWPVLFGIALVESFIIASILAIHIRLRKTKNASGIESMIGDSAIVIEWQGKKGNVRYDGEIWKARSENDLTLDANEKVIIQKVNKLELIITPQ